MPVSHADAAEGGRGPIDPFQSSAGDAHRVSLPGTAVALGRSPEDRKAPQISHSWCHADAAGGGRGPIGPFQSFSRKRSPRFPPWDRGRPRPLSGRSSGSAESSVVCSAPNAVRGGRGPIDPVQSFSRKRSAPANRLEQSRTWWRRPGPRDRAADRGRDTIPDTALATRSRGGADPRRGQSARSYNEQTTPLAPSP